MDHENGVVFIQYEDHLQIAATASLPDDKPFVIFSAFGIRRSGVFDNPFRFFGRDAMLRYVVDIPIDPTIVHFEAFPDFITREDYVMSIVEN